MRRFRGSLDNTESDCNFFEFGAGFLRFLVGFFVSVPVGLFSSSSSSSASSCVSSSSSVWAFFLFFRLLGAIGLDDVFLLFVLEIVESSSFRFRSVVVDCEPDVSAFFIVFGARFGLTIICWR